MCDVDSRKRLDETSDETILDKFSEIIKNVDFETFTTRQLYTKVLVELDFPENIVEDKEVRDRVKALALKAIETFEEGSDQEVENKPLNDQEKETKNADLSEESRKRKRTASTKKKEEKKEKIPKEQKNIPKEEKVSRPSAPRKPRNTQDPQADPKVEKLKKYVTDLKIGPTIFRGLKDLESDQYCTELKKRIIEKCRAEGVSDGLPTPEQVQFYRKTRAKMMELEGIDMTNILETEGRPRRARNTPSPIIPPKKKAYSSSDDEESQSGTSSDESGDDSSASNPEEQSDGEAAPEESGGESQSESESEKKPKKSKLFDNSESPDPENKETLKKVDSEEKD